MMTLQQQASIAAAHYAAGRYHEAQAAYEAALALAPDHVDLLRPYHA